MVVAFDEVIDNSIRANARHITYASKIDRGGRVTGLVAKDDGVRRALQLVLAAGVLHAAAAHVVGADVACKAHQACR